MLTISIAQAVASGVLIAMVAAFAGFVLTVTYRTEKDVDTGFVSEDDRCPCDRCEGGR